MHLGLIDLVGFAAGGLVFLTFCMKTLISLRLVAIASNVAFIAYGFAAGLYPILILHGLLLPMNLFRVWQQRRDLQRLSVTAAPSALALLPYMTAQTIKPGEVLFRRGDLANRLYYISRGAVRIDELDRRLELGTFFGEVGLFAADQQRTATVRCIEPGQVAWIERGVILDLCRDRPEFTLTLTRLIATRMADNSPDAGTVPPVLTALGAGADVKADAS